MNRVLYEIEIDDPYVICELTRQLTKDRLRIISKLSRSKTLYVLYSCLDTRFNHEFVLSYFTSLDDFRNHKATMESHSKTSGTILTYMIVQLIGKKIIPV